MSQTWSLCLLFVRRAHLKECFETLKKNIPNVDEKKTSNLSVLRSALRYIQVSCYSLIMRWKMWCVVSQLLARRHFTLKVTSGLFYQTNSSDFFITLGSTLQIQARTKCSSSHFSYMTWTCVLRSSDICEYWRLVCTSLSTAVVPSE